MADRDEVLAAVLADASYLPGYCVSLIHRCVAIGLDLTGDSAEDVDDKFFGHCFAFALASVVVSFDFNELGLGCNPSLKVFFGQSLLITTMNRLSVLTGELMKAPWLMLTLVVYPRDL